MAENILQKNPHPLGAQVESDGVRFSFVSKSSSCGVMLYDRKTEKLLKKIPFTEEERIGHVYCKIVKEIDPNSTTYLFFEEDRLVPDERARLFSRKIPYGKERNAEDMKAGFAAGAFDWGQDRFPRLPYHKIIAYCMHVRGFTKHASSNVKQRGTFAGVVEKIPYLKEIGVTTVELQPAYEFAEIPVKEKGTAPVPHMKKAGILESSDSEKLNYWGYKKGYYYMPKAAYAFSDDAAAEFKEMVKAFHENHMEVVMQFYFPNTVRQMEIIEILRFWVLEYHVDGFHLMGENPGADFAAMDDVLADTKLWYYAFHTDRVYSGSEKPLYPHVAEYNDAWYYDMRRFLKGDAGMLNGMMYHMRHIPEKAGGIHYMSNYYGFTLADMVSYDEKHNAANGEENRDGNDYNCSWNCGEEGPTRRQTVRKLRLKQIKNAMSLILLSQSTPLIFMGDEFGNSQKGNNNPYCQDNAVTWLDWGGITKNAEIFAFWKMLVDFRHKNPILSPDRELRLTDYIACGYPDLSYHGQNAWCPQTEGNYRHIGIMLCGKYAKAGDGGGEAFLYLAVNMHWESHGLALPRLPKGMKWKEAFSTESGREESRTKTQEEGPELIRAIAPRSMTMYVGVLAPS